MKSFFGYQQSTISWIQGLYDYRWLWCSLASTKMICSCPKYFKLRQQLRYGETILGIVEWWKKLKSSLLFFWSKWQNPCNNSKVPLKKWKWYNKVHWHDHWRDTEYHTENKVLTANTHRDTFVIEQRIGSRRRVMIRSLYYATSKVGDHLIIPRFIPTSKIIQQSLHHYHCIVHGRWWLN